MRAGLEKPAKAMIFLAFLAGVQTIAMSPAMAGDIVKWVDESGVVHFGNPGMAPAGRAEAVNVEPANGMDAPDGSQVVKRGSGPHVVTIKGKQRRKLRGFRGHYSSPGRSARSGRHSSR